MQVPRRKRQKPQMLPMHSMRPTPGWQAPQDVRVMRHARAGPPTHPTMHAPTKPHARGKPPMRATRLMRMT
ncbi:hypothetical protein BLA15816_05886 [Burkholderia lata]|nr:hypothetical protein BLA15816_05886 [Burkholderia lata]